METDYEFVAIIFVSFGDHLKGTCYLDAWFNEPESNQGNEHVEICPLFSVNSFYKFLNI
jgi:hypothetical protein